jgi:hypothetical protein
LGVLGENSQAIVRIRSDVLPLVFRELSMLLQNGRGAGCNA